MSYFENPFAANQRTRCRALGQLGDVNPIEYGGGFVLRCTGGGREGRATHEIEIAPHAEEESDPITVYRVEVPDDVFREYSWARASDVAQMIGTDTSTLVGDMGLSRDPVQRARAVEAIADYYGWHELDQYPLKLSRSELRRRWRSFLRSRS